MTCSYGELAQARQQLIVDLLRWREHLPHEQTILNGGRGAAIRKIQRNFAAGFRYCAELDIRRCFKSFRAEHLSRLLRLPESRAVVILGAILNHGMRLDALTRNVTDGAKKDATGKRTRFLSFDELKLLGKVLDDSPAEPPSGLAAARFLLLTGFRRNEALTLKGHYCMPEKNLVSLPDTKTGAQARVLGKAALDGIWMSWGKNAWVFPAERGEGHFVGLPKCLGRICAEAGIEGVSAHTFRHTFAAVAATLGYSELTIAGLLGHAAGSVTARYAHVADAALVSAANHVSGVIARALAGADVEDQIFPDRDAA